MLFSTQIKRYVLSTSLSGSLTRSSSPIQNCISITTRRKADCCDFENKDGKKSPRRFQPVSLHKDSAKAWADLPPCPDPECKEPCKRRRGKVKGILHDIKLSVIKGGTNFGTPLWRLKCDKPVPKEKVVKKKDEVKLEAVPPPMPEPRKGVQVAILGAETSLGQYLALLLKQCSCVKMVRLYEAECSKNKCDRDICKTVEDLMQIDTNCDVQAFSCRSNHLDRALQCNDIVVILGSGNEKARGYNEYYNRFYYHAPMMVQYANAISYECPRAFVIVCATPVEMNVPVIAEAMKETRWYDPLRLMGSMALPEMRASTLAANTLSLQPCYTRVPCVMGTEGETLVPLFSNAIENFDFSPRHECVLTEALRKIPFCTSRSDCCGHREAELSEAHATANLVKKVGHALICKDHPRLYGYVDTNYGLDVPAARYMSIEVELNGNGISKYFPVPKMNCFEQCIADHAIMRLEQRMALMEEWYSRYLCCCGKMSVYRNSFFCPQELENIKDCAYTALN